MCVGCRKEGRDNVGREEGRAGAGPDVVCGGMCGWVKVAIELEPVAAYSFSFLFQKDDHCANRTQRHVVDEIESLMKPHFRAPEKHCRPHCNLGCPRSHCDQQHTVIPRSQCN